MRPRRIAEIERKTRETEIRLRLDLDGQGQAQVATGSVSWITCSSCSLVMPWWT